jgi:hypothetical protein
MSLETGEQISRHQWTEIPISDIAISRVHALAIRDKQPSIQDCGLVVEWRPSHTVDDDEYDFDYTPPSTTPTDHPLVDDDVSITLSELADLNKDEDKLKHLLEYIKGTVDMKYTIGADNLNEIHTWVDASYAVHPDMQSHTGGVISFGTGGVYCRSTKQKLNTKSSTEAELVGASDNLPNTIWVQNVLQSQGFSNTKSVLEQDNESTIRLEKKWSLICWTQISAHQYSPLLDNQSNSVAWSCGTPLPHVKNVGRLLYQATAR